MPKAIFGTPEGTRDRLFSECRDRRAAQSLITSLFKKRGFSEVITPEVEFYDLFDSIEQETMLKIVDRTGKILVMRPDSTTPIARVAATKLKNSVFPQRLYYNQTVFRSDIGNLGNDAEIQQCGVELLGAAGVKGDAEVTALAIDVLEACGVENYHIELGHPGYFKALAGHISADTNTLEHIRESIATKNFTRLRSILAPYEQEKAAKALEELAFLFGGVEVLDRAEKIADEPKALEAVNYLRTLYSELEKAGRGDRVRFDLGLVSRLDYYTGIVFRGYTEGAAKAVVAGGRYDNLTASFGFPLPSTGFAVYVDDLVACLPPAKLPKVRFVIHFASGMLDDAIRELETYPAGEAELSPYEDREESRKLAKDRGAEYLICFGPEGKEEIWIEQV